MTTLNERAAKCMGWTYSAKYEGAYPDAICSNFHDPANSLDSAALVRDKAIEACGIGAFFTALELVIGTPANRGQLYEMLTATPTQITEAAVRCLEAATPPSPSPKP